ncbi:MAG: NINE protein [bacterium]
MDEENTLVARLAFELTPEQRVLFLNLYGQRRRDFNTVLILSIIGGILGLDRLYLGQLGLGAAKLLLCWLTLGIWWIIDIFLIRKATNKVNAKLAQSLYDHIKTWQAMG